MQELRSRLLAFVEQEHTAQDDDDDDSFIDDRPENELLAQTQLKQNAVCILKRSLWPVG